MGSELRRYLADMAPGTWRPLMRLVAYEIADRSPDPTQVEDGDRLADGSIRCRVLLEGHENKQGRYVKGLADYLGMPKRQVCEHLKALAEEGGYEMRIQLRDEDGEPMFDKIGRPAFAVPGRAMRFKVGPLGLALPVDNPLTVADPMGTQKGTLTDPRSPFRVPTAAVRVPKKVTVFPTENLNPSIPPTTLPNSYTPVVATSGGSSQEPSEKSDLDVDNSKEAA